MPALVTSGQVEAIVRKSLKHDGYRTSSARGLGETGCDIIAERKKIVLHIETIAFKSSPPARAKDFYEAFFRAVSRIEIGAKKCVIALPSRFGLGLPQRARAIGVAWRRIGKAFPELQIWLVDTSKICTKSTSRSCIKRTKWGDWTGR